MVRKSQAEIKSEMAVLMTAFDFIKRFFNPKNRMVEVANEYLKLKAGSELKEFNNTVIDAVYIYVLNNTRNFNLKVESITDAKTQIPYLQKLFGAVLTLYQNFWLPENDKEWDLFIEETDKLSKMFKLDSNEYYLTCGLLRGVIDLVDLNSRREAA